MNTRIRVLSWVVLAIALLGAVCLLFPVRDWVAYHGLSLRPIEREFVDVHRLSEINSMVNIKLKDADIWASVSSTQQRVIHSTPRSLDVGLANYSFLAPETRSILLQTIILAGNQEQLERTLSGQRENPLPKEDRLQLLLLLPILKARKIAIDLRWIDLFVDNGWQGTDFISLVSGVGKIVDYKPLQVGGIDSQDAGKRWSDFCTWWNTNRSNLISPPGEPIRKAP